MFASQFEHLLAFAYDGPTFTRGSDKRKVKLISTDDRTHSTVITPYVPPGGNSDISAIHPHMRHRERDL
jgi:hypothetical protein